jgi:hypothetical protein
MIAYVVPQGLNEVEPPIDTLVNVGGVGRADVVYFAK